MKKIRKKTMVIQLKLAKSFDHGGARRGAGRPKSDNQKVTLWLSNTTLAMMHGLKGEGVYSDDSVIAAGMIALADAILAGRAGSITDRVKLTRANILRSPGN